MTDAQQPLIIKDFQTAVADSPHVGHGLMRNLDIDSFAGSLKVARRTRPSVIGVTSQTFTADAPSDVCTAAGSLITQAATDVGITFVGQAVQFTTTGTLPAGLSLLTTYFLIYVSNTTFKVATTYANANAGTAINITDAGTGTHTVTQVPVGTINQLLKDPRSGFYFAYDSNGRIWYSRGGTQMYLLTGNTITATSGSGIALFRTSDGLHTYLFVFRNAVIDVIDVFGTTNLDTPVWNTAWQTMNTGAGALNPHYAIVAQDNIIYFTDDRWVGSIMEKAGSVFDPTNAATYSYNNQALDMPQGEINDWLEELGINLLVAGRTYNKIYPWDRISDSFNLPLNVPETNVYRMRNLGGMVYILAGSKGNIYYTQGTYVKFFKTLPQYISNNGGTILSNPVTWGGIATSIGSILFGASVQTTGNSGIYRLYPDGRIIQDQTPYGGSQQVNTIYAENDLYSFGYAGQIDYSDSNRYASGTYAGVYHSALYRVGQKTKKAGYSELQVQIAKPSTTGQIRVGYRPDDSSSFVVLATFVSDSVSTSFASDIGLIDIESIQVQVEADGNVEVTEVGLYP